MLRSGDWFSEFNVELAADAFNGLIGAEVNQLFDLNCVSGEFSGVKLFRLKLVEVLSKGGC